MKNFKLLKKIEKEIILLKIKYFKDKRGNFFKIFSQNELKINNQNFNIKQVNFVQNKQKGITRGLHYQSNHYAERKIITCVKGKIQNVIVQMNKRKKNYLKSYTFILSEKNKKVLIVPKNYSNGYQVLTNKTEVIYCSDNFYNKNYENIINPDDPKIKINWKLKKKIQTKKDKFSKFLK